MAKIKIDKDLHQRAGACANELGYSSVDEFVEHLVERAVREHEGQKENKEEEDKERVEERLRGLGYID
jgi:hypothetical protein